MHKIGSIPFDIKGNQIALLFVTSQTRGRWILPKGSAKPGENHIQTSERESFEEAGVKGKILEDFPMTVSISKQTSGGKQATPVTFYPLYVGEQSEDWPEQDKRERHWALLSDASKVVHREDYLALVKQFEALEPFIKEAAKAHKS